MTEAPKDPQVAEYIEGMGSWQAEFEALRPVLLRAGLDEELKWRKPCYTHDGSNVVIFQPFKDLCALLFFKGALLEDPDGALNEQGEKTRSASSSALSPTSTPRRTRSPRSPRTRSGSSRPASRSPSAPPTTTAPTPM